MPTTVLPLRRYAFIAGASTLLVVLVSWVAVRAVEPAEADTRVPLMVQPTMPLTASSPAASGSADSPPAPSATPTARASTSPVVRVSPVSGSTTAKPAATTKPTPRRSTTPPAPAAAFTASYTGQTNWDRGFTGKLSVTNESGPARTWTIKLTFDHDAEVRITNTWNAQTTRQGDTYVLTGGRLAPGATASVGFQASKRTRAKTQPTTCTVDGAACQVD